LNYNPVEERMIIQFMHVITLFSTLEWIFYSSNKTLREHWISNSNWIYINLKHFEVNLVFHIELFKSNLPSYIYNVREQIA
jgi:hypothetical protein